MTLKISVTLRIRTLVQNQKWRDAENLPGPDKLMFETWNRSYVSSYVKNKRCSRLTGDSLQSCGKMNVTLYSPDVQTQVQEHSTFFLSYNLPLILSLVFTKFLTYSLDLLDFFCFLIYHATLSLWIFLNFFFFFLFVNFVNSGQGFVTRSESPKLWAAILISLRFERDQEFKMCSLHGFHKQHTVVVYTKLKGKKQYIQH